MAAKVRFGDIQYDRAQKISNIPIPKIIAEQRRGGRSSSRTSATRRSRRISTRPSSTGRRSPTLAKRGGVSNKWSQKALENLAREFPDEYKALRQELVQGTDAP